MVDVTSCNALCILAPLLLSCLFQPETTASFGCWARRASTLGPLGHLLETVMYVQTGRYGFLESSIAFRPTSSSSFFSPADVRILAYCHFHRHPSLRSFFGLLVSVSRWCQVSVSLCKSLSCRHVSEQRRQCFLFG
jgi:hypothetical protein